MRRLAFRLDERPRSAGRGCKLSGPPQSARRLVCCRARPSPKGCGGHKAYERLAQRFQVCA
jgi:hypothetical protein